MPIIEVELVGDSAGSSSMAGELADALALALEARPDGTWVKVAVLPEALYAEGGGGPAVGIRPVFVRIVKAELAVGTELQAQALRVADAVSAVCGRPRENVHVIYEPQARGRIAFGGQLLD